ncbi:hypothetical protein GCM10023079_46740 [Streptomyces chitinivorans]
MKIRKTLGVSAATFALAFGFANQAYAADHTMYTGDAFGSVTGYSGRATFDEYGDIVKICDIDADGHAVRMRVYTGGRPGNGGVLRYSFYRGGRGQLRHQAGQ